MRSYTLFHGVIGYSNCIMLFKKDSLLYSQRTKRVLDFNLDI